jgi:uncharacterized delta-60 repeat protein
VSILARYRGVLSDFLALLGGMLDRALGGEDDPQYPNFRMNLGSAANSDVDSITAQSDGKILLGGNFTTWNGTTVNRIVRLNSDGTTDTAFTTSIGTAANARVRQVVIQSDGKILVVGDFTTWDGTTVNRIVRLNSDGTRDAAFTTNAGTAANGTVFSVAIQTGGKILLGGNFTTWDGGTVGRVVLLNSDGTTDTAFTTNVGTGSDASVFTLNVQPDGKMLLGGTFTIWNGDTVNRLVRLNSDGTRDTAFTTNTGTAADGNALSVAAQSDGKILVGGAFTTWDGVTVGRVVRLNSDGTRDAAFTTNTGTAANNQLRSIAVQSDGKILVGGDFATWDGVTVNRIVRLNSDGTRDTAFTTNTGTGATSTVVLVAPQSDGKILLGGVFTTWNGNPVNRLVRLNSDGTFDPTPGANSTIFSIAVQSDGKILLGGAFTTWNGTTVNRIVRLNSDGTRDAAFTTNAGTAANNIVYSIAVQTDGKILVGGAFTTWNGTTVNRIVRLNSDGTRDAAFTTNAGTAANGTVDSIAVQSDGKILLGGNFTTWDGTTVNRIVRLNSDGTRDTAFTTNAGTAANNSVVSIAVQSDGKIVVVGRFTTWTGVTVGRIVRLNANGTRDTAFSGNTGTGIGAAVSARINSTSIQSDGKILVAGNFSTWNGVSGMGSLVRLNTDGTRDAAFSDNVGTGTPFQTSFEILRVTVHPSGNILVGGNMISWNGVDVGGIVRLNSDGTRDTAFTTNTGTAANTTISGNELRDFAVQSDGKILVAGAFSVWNGTLRLKLARLGGGDAQ